MSKKPVGEFTSFDELVTQEMYFERQKIRRYGAKNLKDLLTEIAVDMQDGSTIRRAKKKIAKTDINPNLEKDLAKMMKQQSEIITGKKQPFNLDQESLHGVTFKESFDDVRIGYERRARRFAVRVRELAKDGRLGTEISINKLVDEEVQRHTKYMKAYFRDSAKVAREYAYRELEADSEKDIRGWMSIAILDSRTSAKCAGLHNRFYSKEEYGSRENIPDVPPRHPHCRSIIITVYHGNDIRHYKGQNLNTFLKRNPKVAEEMMGKEKYRLWMGGKAKIDKYVDMNNGKWFTNKEIIKRLGIKSKKRLRNDV